MLYASIHQWPLYPGTGAAEYAGEGAGEGYTVNLPVPAGAGSEEFLALVEHVVVPIGREYAPGPDRALGRLRRPPRRPARLVLVETDAYGDMTAAMRDLGAELGAPVLVCLEGGYSPSALADSVVATLAALNNGTAPRAARDEAAEPHLSRLRERWRL